jgi:hypothetical protein
MKAQVTNIINIFDNAFDFAAADFAWDINIPKAFNIKS